jgi:uncharacterized protein
MLAGRELIAQLVHQPRQLQVLELVNAVVQTSAVRLSGVYLELFDELGILCRSASTEAPKHRTGAACSQAGKAATSFEEARISIEAPVQRAALHHRHAQRPLTTYDALDPPAVDFLLPHVTWDTSPREAGFVPGPPYADSRT